MPCLFGATPFINSISAAPALRILEYTEKVNFDTLSCLLPIFVHFRLESKVTHLCRPTMMVTAKQTSLFIGLPPGNSCGSDLPMEYPQVSDLEIQATSRLSRILMATVRPTLRFTAPAPPPIGITDPPMGH
jgi:hypothetical protein